MKGYKDEEKMTTILDNEEGTIILIRFKNNSKSEDTLKLICKELGLQYG